MNSIVILSVDDWEVLYVNGKEELQRHTIDISDIVKYCPIETIYTEWVTGKLEEWTKDVGRFPDTLDKCFEIDPDLKAEWRK